MTTSYKSQTKKQNKKQKTLKNTTFPINSHALIVVHKSRLFGTHKMAVRHAFRLCPFICAKWVQYHLIQIGLAKQQRVNYLQASGNPTCVVAKSKGMIKPMLSCKLYTSSQCTKKKKSNIRGPLAYLHLVSLK